MDKRRSHKQEAKNTANSGSEEEVSSIKWEYVKMSEDEVDLIYRMYRLVGDRWHLIAGRIPGRKAEEIERFWIMAHSETFSRKRNEPAYPTKD
ncbi:MYB-like transcription factor ETC3 [Pyrus ussuriensis x Pyrus communis]|uniref:MYB-like transcription factor ETC3 n=1 Tax=Pyrus ussuriensis x Pyrus communis TaxID=2448454 RepID=A0A5N5I184_9ROSA|nr:MYB-like transcription factor ETC3 isoform X2 [Pyrus x bretschneideri]KAB2632897.1 MYB-like transcription factor ETC3 [Pyrus ussuriensis x Pyrus communis]